MPRQVGVAEVVLEVIAVILEHIVALVFDFPAAATGNHRGPYRLPSHGLVGGKGIVVQHLAGGFTDDVDLAPVDHQGLLITSQRDLLDIAIGPPFVACPSPHPVFDRLHRTTLG